MQRVQRDIEAIETCIRTASVPEMDRIHQRHRNEREALEKLVAIDGDLVLTVKELHDAITTLGDGGTAAGEASALLKASGVDSIWRDREKVLSILAD